MTTFAESYVPTAPRVTVNGVEWEISYGEGWNHDPLWGVGPVYVWRCVDAPEVTAMPHVSEACDCAYELQCEVEAAESAAGWSY